MLDKKKKKIVYIDPLQSKQHKLDKNSNEYLRIQAIWYVQYSSIKMSVLV